MESSGLCAWVYVDMLSSEDQVMSLRIHLRLLSWERASKLGFPSGPHPIWVPHLEQANSQISGPDPSLLTICLTLQDFRHIYSLSLLEAIQHLG